MKARVFISCGQRKGTKEEETARQIAYMLQIRGYDPYLALTEQTLRGLKENIFSQLEECDFFLFIDFRRDNLSDGGYRGSLFSHQELAIASYLDKPILALRQQDVREVDGMLVAMQVNANIFNDYSEVLPLAEKKLSEEEAKGNWSPIHPNTISFLDPIRFERPSVSRQGVTHLFFHLPVVNMAAHRIVRNARIYITRCWDEREQRFLAYEIAELQWTGVHQFPEINLFPSFPRKADGVKFESDQPLKAMFNIMTNDRSGLFAPRCDRVGKFILEYTIYSDNFSPVIDWFELHIASDWHQTYLKHIDMPHFFEK